MTDFVIKMGDGNWLAEPERIFIVDETSFCLNPKLGKVIGKRGAKNVYSITIENEKDCYTALIGGKFFSLKKIVCVISLIVLKLIIFRAVLRCVVDIKRTFPPKKKKPTSHLSHT